MSHNINDMTVMDQMNDTTMVTLDRLSIFVIESGCNNTGLERWLWQLARKGDTRTRVVVAYHPNKPGPNSKGYIVWEYHEYYFEANGDFTSPRTIFFEQLICLLLLWRIVSEELILCRDFNKNVYNGCIMWRLAKTNLHMSKQCLKLNREHLPAMFAEGS